MLLRKMILGAGRNTGGGGSDEPTGIGEPFQGGYYAGKMNYSDGEYWLIVSPKSTETTAQWKTTTTTTAGTDSLFDGLVNTLALNNATHPAGKHCADLFVNGYDDWYLPARDELELCYRNLKPTTSDNFTTSRPVEAGTGLNGTNSNSVPIGEAYTTTNPAQTLATKFKTGGTEAFQLYVGTDWYLTSTQSVTSSGRVIVQGIVANGQQTSEPKTTVRAVRAVRRVKIPPTP